MLSITGIFALAWMASGCIPPVPEYPLQPIVDDTAAITPPTVNESRTCDNYSSNRNPYFGDTHVHTVYSLDAWMASNFLTPRQAYQFAKGQPVGLSPFDSNGNPTRTVTIERTLDFVMLADHAETFGEQETCANPALPGYNSKDCKHYRNSLNTLNLLINWNSVSAQPQDTASRFSVCGFSGALCIEHSKSVWQRIIKAAQIEYDTSNNCDFTTFVGYEWTANPYLPNTFFPANLHRNVMFKDDQVPEVPISYLDAQYPEDLWQALSDSCLNGTPNCDVLTIPHNSNVSAGRMFEQIDKNGNAFDLSYAQDRAQWEPVIEIMQQKGQSECGYDSIGNDEFCGMDLLPYHTLAGTFIGGSLPPENAFVRDALKEGTKLQDDIGANPFQYGFIGSTDGHSSMPGKVSENNFPGHDGANLISGEFGPGLTDLVENNPGGLAVVWAEQNSRHSLFDAIRRKETYATSGTRPIIRFFGGWNYGASICSDTDLVDQGYAGGVAMGGVLPAVASTAPVFVISAVKDPQSVNIQRVQIVKGWTDSNGDTHESIYDVAGGSNGASVNISDCSTAGTGLAQTCTRWVDPNFNSSENAFYYTRVIENPVCRWNQYQCNAAGVDCNIPATVTAGYGSCCNASAPKTTQEKAWTSPIWYKN